MDAITIVTSVASSLGLSIPAAAWLSQNLIKHRLDKDMTVFKGEVEAVHKARQASLDGEIKQHVDTVLGERAADRQYAFEAKKRLYSAIGPLRFQLLLACRDLAGRIMARGRAGAEGYSTGIGGYYGRSTLYRILRPLCISELIERQIAYADFAVDPGAVDLLRFKKSAFSAFAGDILVSGHPRVNWDHQLEHVYVDNLTRCASALITTGATPADLRVMRFHEFESFVADRDNLPRIAPFPDLLATMTPTSKPLLWLRLVGYAALCNDLINRTGGDVGFEQEEYPVRDLLLAGSDPLITAHVADYVARCESLTRVRL
jgi:hypothetical protein